MTHPHQNNKIIILMSNEEMFPALSVLTAINLTKYARLLKTSRNKKGVSTTDIILSSLLRDGSVDSARIDYENLMIDDDYISRLKKSRQCALKEDGTVTLEPVDVCKLFSVIKSASSHQDVGFTIIRNRPSSF